MLDNVVSKIDQYRKPERKGEVLAVCSPVRILGENVEFAMKKIDGNFCFDVAFEGYVLSNVYSGVASGVSFVFGIPGRVGRGIGSIFTTSKKKAEEQMKAEDVMKLIPKEYLELLQAMAQNAPAPQPVVEAVPVQ